MAMDEIIDYVTLDQDTGKRVWQIENYDQDGLIFIRKDLVNAFNMIFHGDGNGWMINKPTEKVPALKYLSPPEGGFDLKNDTVWIRKAVPFKQVWADRPVPYQVMIAGFGYKVQQMMPNGFPTTETIPMIDWNDPDIEGVMTESIPVGVFHDWFELGWHEIKPILTMIEKTIAKTLEGRGIKEAEQSGVTIAKMMTDADNEGGDFSL